MAPEGHYTVGYAKPPRHSRFRKGTSGNPQGRPTALKNIATILGRVLDEKVVVTDNGRRRRISKREAIITQLVNRSAQADLKASQMLLGLMHDLDRRADNAVPEEGDFDAADAEVIQHLKKRLSSTGGRPDTMELRRCEYDALLRADFTSFFIRSFAELHGGIAFKMSGHIEVIANRLVTVRGGDVRRLIINVPPRHLKSLIGSVAFPAWCLGHDPAAQVMCVSYAQDLADKHARDCRSLMTSSWYRRLFPRTRLASLAVQELVTTTGGVRLASSVGVS